MVRMNKEWLLTDRSTRFFTHLHEYQTTQIRMFVTVSVFIIDDENETKAFKLIGDFN